MDNNKLTVRDFAKLCEISTVTIYDYIKRGLLTPRKSPIGKNYFLKEDVEILKNNLENYQLSKKQ